MSMMKMATAMRKAMTTIQGTIMMKMATARRKAMTTMQGTIMEQMSMLVTRTTATIMKTMVIMEITIIRSLPLLETLTPFLCSETKLKIRLMLPFTWMA